MSAEEQVTRRVDAILAAADAGGDEPNDLYMVTVHAAAAQRRCREAIDAIDAAQSGDERAWMGAMGDASHAVLSLYLAASAAQRYCNRTGNPGPLGRPDLDQLVTVSRHFRDAVMHWDDKLERDPRTFLAVTRCDVLVLAPLGRREKTAQVAQLSWDGILSRCGRLGGWAAETLRDAPPEEPPDQGR